MQLARHHTAAFAFPPSPLRLPSACPAGMDGSLTVDPAALQFPPSSMPTMEEVTLQPADFQCQRLPGCPYPTPLRYDAYYKGERVLYQPQKGGDPELRYPLMTMRFLQISELLRTPCWKQHPNIINPWSRFEKKFPNIGNQILISGVKQR